MFVRPIETVQRMGFESRQCRVASRISIEGVGAKSKKSYNCGQKVIAMLVQGRTAVSYYLMVHVKMI